MKEESLISIIVPIYNAEHYLSKTINSIINQSYRNIEIILVNDGSTDESKKICEAYVKFDNRIRLINKQNGGVSSARNLGIDNSSGEFIGFVDSDDYIDSLMFEKLFESIIEHEADIAECGYYIVKGNGEIIKSVLNDEVIVGKYNCALSYLKKINTTNYNVNKLYKKKFFKDLRYPDYHFSEDFYVNASVFPECNKKITIKDRLYHYVQNDQSATQREFNTLKLDMIRAGEDLISSYRTLFPELTKYINLYIMKKSMFLYNEILKSNIDNKREIANKVVGIFNRHRNALNIQFIRESNSTKQYIYISLFKLNPYLYYLIKKQWQKREK